MAVTKVKTKIIKTKSGYSVIIPKELWEKLDIKPKDQVRMFLNPKNHYEIEITDQEQVGKCELCGQKRANRKCIACKREVCVSCYWEMGGLCRGCMK